MMCAGIPGVIRVILVKNAVGSLDELIEDGGAFGLAVLVGVVALALEVGLNSMVAWK
jgi:hypothetical protein